MNINPDGYPRKLIEVVLPLTEISEASIAEKHRSVGTVKNFHKWFAPMPTPAVRALIFASLVSDPGEGQERDKLINIVRSLVPRDGTPPTEQVLRVAREVIRKSNPTLPNVLDPFIGGGSTLIEAMRLGVPSVGADLNPVATLISRTLGEVLPGVAHASSISGREHSQRSHDLPYDGFSEDLKHYAAIIQNRVKSKLDKYYPRPQSGSPVAWIWARTTPCANPACSLTVPLFTSPWLSKQKGREVSAEAVVIGDSVEFVLHRGKRDSATSTKLAGRMKFACPKCGTPIGDKELRLAAKAGLLGTQLIAFCTDTKSGRIYLSPSEIETHSGEIPMPEDIDEIAIGVQDSRTIPYGIEFHHQLYTSRQLAVLAEFASEVNQIAKVVVADGGSETYGRAITTVLGICVSKMAQSNSMLVRWYTREGPSRCMPAFARQAIQMYWDFAECYPFGESVGSWNTQISSIIASFGAVPVGGAVGRVAQMDARKAGSLVKPGSALIVTDPPYFDQINYADLSDYFYPWLRRALRDSNPELFATIATPKAAELVANHVRHGNREGARQYFIEGFKDVFASLKIASRPDLPLVVAYAAKQDEKGSSDSISTAWESLLEAILTAGLAVVGTLPIEATHKTRQVSQGSNALASYIILVCRPRVVSDIADKGTFLARLREELPEAIEALRRGGISPLDMGQAAIGPGMRIFSQYREVLQPDGTPMSVGQALIEINKASTEIIDGDEAEYDAATRFCLKWFRNFAFDQGPYGRADVFLREIGTTIRDLVEAGIVSNTPRSTVSLLDFEELPTKYDPVKDERISHWEVAMHLAKRFKDQGIDGAAHLVAGVRSRTDTLISLDRVNRLVHRLFKISDRKYQKTAAMFNELGTAWPDIMTAAQSVSPERYVTTEIDNLFSSFEEEADDDDE